MSDRPTPETDSLYKDDHRPNLLAHSRKLERQRDELLEALESLTRHRPIMGSTGDYREGQVHILESVTRIAKAAIDAVKGGEG